MRPLTQHTPKPLLKVGGKTLLEHQISFLEEHVQSIAVTVGYKSDQVSKMALEKGINFIINNFGGGNANWLNIPLVREMDSQVVVITCDNLMEIDFKKIKLELSLKNRNNYIFTRNCGEGLSGDRINANEGRIDSVSPTNKSTSLATGLQIINPRTLTPNVNFTNFHEVWSDSMSTNSLFESTVHPSKWLAIDTPTDLENANRDL